MTYNKIEKYKIIIDDELNSIYNDGPKLLKEPINHILSGGKRLRPILCLLSFESLKKEINNEVISIATAIELLHIFTLIHDDIMDNDVMRHGNATIHHKWNIPIGILAGDAVLALALSKINNSSNNIKESFNKALLKVCEGQALDIEYESLNSLSVDDYFDMIKLKTGYMLGLSAQLGSLSAGLDLKSSNKFMDFGILLGKAFQLQDDLLEIVSTKEQMGKTLMSDVALNKKTYIFLIAEKYYPNEIKQIFDNFNSDNYKLNKRFKEFLHDNNIIKKCEIKIDSTFKQIDELITDFNLDNKNLKLFINNVRNRKF